MAEQNDSGGNVAAEFAGRDGDHGGIDAWRGLGRTR